MGSAENALHEVVPIIPNGEIFARNNAIWFGVVALGACSAKVFVTELSQNNFN